MTWAFLASMLAPGGASVANEIGATVQKYTVILDNRAIDEALTDLSQLAGVSIELAGETIDRRVSVRLEQATLEQAISKLLAAENYIVVNQLDGGISILLLDRVRDPSQPPSENPQSQADFLEKPQDWEMREQGSPLEVDGDEMAMHSEDLFETFDDWEQPLPEDLEIVPPEEGKEFSLFEADLQEPETSETRWHPSFDEVLPPEIDGTFGMTVAELQKELTADPPMDEPWDELVPPDDETGEVLFVKDLEGSPDLEFFEIDISDLPGDPDVPNPY